MRQHIIHTLLPVCLAVLTAAATLQSCTDKDIAIPDYTVAGQPVTLRVPIAFPEMDEITRGDLSENQMNRVTSLWIRTYSADDGKATSNWKKLEEEDYPLGVITPESEHTVSLNTKSGPSYIVAVANVDNPAVTKDAPGTLSTLRVLLDKADTWADFLNIAVPSPSDQTQLNAPQVNALPMAGCFSDVNIGTPHPEPITLSTWQTKNFQPYTIPASTAPASLKGYIHLRRLVSHITFNFISGDDNMELEVNSYQVMNAPKFSWLYERPTDTDKGYITNFGDAATEENAGTYYADVPQFGSQFIKEKDINGTTWQSFNFWQAENKHTGTCELYSNRDEKTIKDGVTLFTSLTGDSWTPNNEASYVIVDCSINYKDDIKVDAEGAIDNENGSKVTRSANATYIIHLGYINKRTNDFSCFRNVNYTYNVTVNGVDDIRVDAFATTEKYHGEEGLVVDLDAHYIELDAHYGVFNIQLTKQELENNFGFIITTYDNGEQITINEDNPRYDGDIFADEAMKNKIDPKYYNWIELRPTSGPNELALYKPRFGPNKGEDTFLLSDLYTKDGTLHIPDEKCISESGWYTVFVNEYTYEPMYTGTDGYANEEVAPGVRPKWMDYVNQNPRRFYIKVSYHESPDGNSVYARSKYAVEQQSLMTYFSQIHVDKEGTAIGVERENETFGLNLRFFDDSGGSSLTNGRWNAAQYLTAGANDHHLLNEDYNANDKWNSISVSRPIEQDRSSWAFFLVMNEPLEVAGVTDALKLQGGPIIKERTIANGNPHKLRKIKTGDDLALPNFSDPQNDKKYTIRAMSALVNRNRDNNGNGKIEAEELRWYIPAITRYVGMTLGENAMPQRLMNFEEIQQLPYVYNKRFSMSTEQGEINNCFYTRYMYLASNYVENASQNNVLWALEGTSLSQYKNLKDWSVGSESNLSINPWQIRCVRNLGSDLRTVKFEGPVTMPFTHDKDNRILNMKYFNLAAIRTTMLTGNGEGNSNFMPIQTINSPLNSIYSGFKYAENDLTYDKQGNENNFCQYIENYINTNPCSVLGNGWRLPNQIELTMLYLSDVLENKSTSWLSSTVQYISTKGQGNNSTTDKLFLGSVHDHTLLLTWSNYQEKGIRVRCVRDVNP